MKGRVDDSREVATDRREVDLVTKPLGEEGRRPLGVVASPVEAMVDGALDAPPERLEEGGGKERGARHGDGLALDQVAEEALEQQDGAAYTASSNPLSTAHDRPRLISRSIS